MSFIWLSYPLSTEAPRPPAIPAPSLTEFMSIEKDGANVQFLQCYNHTGTHLDTAAHVIKDGASLEGFIPEDLVYNDVRIISISLPDDTFITAEHIKPFGREIQDCEALIVVFSVTDRRKNDPLAFSNHCPGFSCSGASEIFKFAPNLRMIGTDVPSIACISHLDETMKVHNYFFETARTKKFIIIEEMNVTVHHKKLKRMIVSPWFVENMNSGPCVVWGETE
jgi:kynurenine formamidase